MFGIKKLILFNAISSVHMGSGSKLGVVDQPVQREAHTNFPYIPSSGIKGGFREYVDEDNKDCANILFGCEEEGGKSKPGEVIFTDAKILFFPVKSLFGVFAWVTSPFVLSRFKEDLKLINSTLSNFDIDKINEDNKVYEIEGNSLIKDSKITLEDFTFDTIETDKLNNILNNFNLIYEEPLFKEKLIKDVVIVSDEIFKYFIENSVDFLPRIKIGEGGTASGKGGNIWYEENIPPQTFFYSLTFCDNKKEEVINYFNKYIKEGYIQLGGNQSIGRGILKYKLF